MRKITVFFIILAALVLLPSLAGAQPWRAVYGEHVAIDYDCSTPCSDQTSATIFKPPDARGIDVYIDVTAGNTLLLDINLDSVWTAPTVKTMPWLADVPSAEGITAISTSHAIFVDGPDPGTHYSLIEERLVVLPTFFKLWVDHGNNNTVTYVVYYRWMW